MSTIDFWRAEHYARAPALPGATLPWLAALRQRALERFGDEGWPTTRQENWRHTSLAFLDQHQLAGAAVPAAYPAVAQLRASAPDEHWLTFIDGRFAPALSAIGALPTGISIGSLADALNLDPDAVEPVFGSVEDGDSPAALNAAFAGDGAWIRLARGVGVEQPIHLVFVSDGLSHRHVRNLITAAAGARASIVEHYLAASDAPTLTTAVTRIDAGPDSHITHTKLQRESNQAIHLARIDAEQARGAVLASHALSFGARLARNDISTRLAGEGAEALLNGLYHADGRRHVDHHTRIDHARPQCTSREFYRGLLDGSARGVFTGRIVVAQDAQRTDAMQRCDNLLLSRLAEADARPELEIYADDVKCAHGATVGQIDDDALFYLRARGVDGAQARQLLTYAFAAQVLDRIGHAGMRKLGQQALFACLPGAAELEALS